MTRDRAYQIAKDYLLAKTGLEATDAQLKDGDRSFNCTVILQADKRKFEVYMAAYGNTIRLTEHLVEETFYSFVKTETVAEKKRRLENEKSGKKGV